MKVNEINNKKDFCFSCIYLWTNLINGKTYVGQTQNFYNRVMQYKRGNDKHRVIGHALLKYGFDNFDISILEKDVSLDNLDEREQYWIDYYHCCDRKIGYNICKEAGTTRGCKHTEETKAKMSKKRKQFFKEHPDALSGENNPQYGKSLLMETKIKMSESRMGNQNAKGSRWSMTEEQKSKISQAMKGKKNCLGRKLSQETKNKIAEGNRGRVVSEETKEKISEANKGKTCRQVLCIETNVIYDSIQDASKFIRKDCSSISKCCRGKQKTCGGFHWRYVDK